VFGVIAGGIVAGVVHVVQKARGKGH
ncbi:MAG: hypothetical protein RIQ46_1682, partial [Pseudomonadota bacterium]